MKVASIITSVLLFYTLSPFAQNVGIGVQNAQYKLDVHNNFSGTILNLRTLKDSVGASTLIQFLTSASANFSGKTAFLGNNYQISGSNLVFGTSFIGQNAEERMRLNYSGNLGLGTSNPSGKFHISLLESNITNAIIIDNNLEESTIQFRQDGVNKGFLQSSDNNLRIGTNSSNADGLLLFSTNGVNKVSVTSAGNVGINTTTPSSVLHILNVQDASIVSNGYIQIGASSGTNVVFDNNEILARNNGALATLYLGQDGSVVEIGDIAFNNNKIQGRNNGLSSPLILQYDGGSVRIGDSTFPTAPKFGVSGSAVITGNLRVGLEPLPIGYSFGVDGKIICTELMVRLVNNWPDYVFDQNYQLPSLNELSNYIQINKHLPGIPNAKEVEKGLSVGEMQKMQMEKIEELTLYILQLKRELDELRDSKIRKK